MTATHTSPRRRGLPRPALHRAGPSSGRRPLRIRTLDGHRHVRGRFPRRPGQARDRVTFTGTDTLRMQGGRFAEYWVNTDTLRWLTQIQAL